MKTNIETLIPMTAGTAAGLLLGLGGVATLGAEHQAESVHQAADQALEAHQPGLAEQLDARAVYLESHKWDNMDAVSKGAGVIGLAGLGYMGAYRLVRASRRAQNTSTPMMRAATH